MSEPRPWIDPLEEARVACDRIAAAPEPSREELCRRFGRDPFEVPLESFCRALFERFDVASWESVMHEWDGVEPVDDRDELGEAGW